MTSCAPSADTTTAPPDSPTQLANLIKESNPAISGLTVTADNSDPANPTLTITGITNNFEGPPATATINIDQDKGITTDPTSFTVTAGNLISPHTVTTPLRVTFEGTTAVSYIATTQIRGAAVSDWIVTEKLSDYITISFGGQSGNLSVTDRTLSIEGLTNSPGEDAGMITFENLPAGFTVEPSTITLPNPAGTDTATSTPTPNTFTITETDNTGNSETYTIAEIELAIKLSIVGTEITGSPLTVSSGDTIPITTAACQLLTAPTVSVVGVAGSRVASTTPFPRYYDRERDTSNNDKFTVTRSLTLEDGNNNIVATGFMITMEFPACTSFAVGDGTTADTAYEIDSAPRLELVSRLVNTDNTNYSNKHYKVTTDIDMGLSDLLFSEAGSGASGKGFEPIGRATFSSGSFVGTNFSGTFDCDGKTISNLYINRPTENYIGLVGSAVNATITNCALMDVNITSRDSVGGLVGYAASTTITNSYVVGAVSGSSNVGGLVGQTSASTISNSYATAAVTGSGSNVGGLVGQARDSSTINNSYATGAVSGTGTSSSNVGGLVGLALGSSTITDSYATGAVTGNSQVGGLVGWNVVISSSTSTITRSYAIGAVTGTASTSANIGLFIGLNGSSSTPTNTGVTASYYNKWSTLMVGSSGVAAKGVGSDTSSVTTANVTGRTTSQMQVASPPQSGNDAVYVGWETSTWNFTTGQYPRLINVVCANRQYNQSATGCTGL